MDSDKLLNLARSLGCLLAESGAEISRVEISRDGGTTWEKVDVIAQTSIVVTLSLIHI